MKKPLLLAFSCSLLLNSAWAVADEEKQDAVLAHVNDRVILQSEYDEYARLRSRNAELPEPQKLMDELIHRELLFQKGEALKLDKEEEFQKTMAIFRYNLLAEGAHDKYLESLKFTEEDLKAHYDYVNQQNEQPTEYKARHILVKGEDTAKALLVALKTGKDFAELAKEKSNDPGSSKNGGDLGWFEATRMVKPFADAVKNLKKGEISEPVETSFGWHIIQLDDMRKAEPPPYESVKSQIEQRLQLKAMQEYVAELQSKAEVKTTEAFEKLHNAAKQASSAE